MSPWHAIVLGALQGVTEFLPISSSGHLVLAQHYFGLAEGDSPKELFFDGVLHFGTLVAVLLYFGKEMRGEVGRFLRGAASHTGQAALDGGPLGESAIRIPHSAIEDKPAWPASWRDLFWLAVLVGVATLPAAGAALIKSDAIKESFKHPRPVALNFIILGGVLLLTTRLNPGQTTGGQTKLWQAFVIGAAQGCSAVFRGLSRSGMTISTSLLVGLERNWAVRFSFMMSVVASLGLGGLGILKALKDPHRAEWLTGEFLGLTLLGTAVAAVVGYLTIGPLIRLVQRAKLGWFAAYLWVAAAVVLCTT